MTALNARWRARGCAKFAIGFDDVFGNHIAQIIIFNDAAARLDDGRQPLFKSIIGNRRAYGGTGFFRVANVDRNKRLFGKIFRRIRAADL